MNPAPPLAPDAALTSLLAFWAEAGVDTAYAEAPVNRLEEGRRRLNAPARTAADNANRLFWPCRPAAALRAGRRRHRLAGCS